MPTFNNDTAGDLQIRRLTEADMPAFLDLIDDLADYERLARPDATARERLRHDAHAQPPRFHALLAERAGRAIGYAIFFETYSSFLAQPTLHLEDLFVLADERRGGVGRRFMRDLAREAVRRGCGRIEWQVLTWNAPAIAFYDRLGGTPLDDWQSYRLTADQFARLGEPAE